MNIRRVQQSGRSLVISLPRSWTDKLRVKKGTNLICNTTKGDGKALVIKVLKEDV
jgi:antitoxin component of MazEF toxin-antitoxin module